MQPSEPHGVAIEARVYAENPAKGYAPSPGTLQIVQWHNIEGSRIDTWVRTGTVVSAHYDPLLAKVMFHSPTREATLEGIHEILSESRICGPPTNLDFLAAILQDQAFACGRTLTKFLTEFRYSPAAIDVVSGGAYTQVQDYPGRPTMVCRPMSLAVEYVRLSSLIAGPRLSPCRPDGSPGISGCEHARRESSWLGRLGDYLERTRLIIFRASYCCNLRCAHGSHAGWQKHSDVDET